MSPYSTLMSTRMGAYQQNNFFYLCASVPDIQISLISEFIAARADG